MENLCLGPDKINSFLNGTMYDAYQYFGAHVTTYQGRQGMLFRVFAPNARNVQVAGDFNHWDGNASWMTHEEKGVWYLFVEGVGEYVHYKYQIETQDYRWLQKADPFAVFSEMRPNTASRTYDINGFYWQDGPWQAAKSNAIYNAPLNIYEMNLGSWKLHDDGSFYNYDEMVDTVIPYVVNQGYTHIEIMPIMEHPFDGSWGYQVSGYYSATSRFGDPKKLMYFIDRCHDAGIGVIVDWVPVHFVKDSHGLIDFDGTPVYEYPFDDLKEMELWGTRNFDFGKGHTRSFLISNALFWLKVFHFDGIRADAVSNIIYYLGDSSRGENGYGVDFLKQLNVEVHRLAPYSLMIAEDSTSYPKVTEPVFNGGLGFDFKWNMGWMNDILKYVETPFYSRIDQHSKITFALMYALNEKFILPLSHDEVVHGKKSIINKMPGTYEQQFAGARALYGLMYTFPGKKLNFMGNEIGQVIEWNEKRGLDFFLLDYPIHSAFNRFMRDLNLIYKNYPALSFDTSYESFEWIDVNNPMQNIVSYIRRCGDQELVVIVNFNDRSYPYQAIGAYPGTYQEILHSDYDIYNGHTMVHNRTHVTKEGEVCGKPEHFFIDVPGLSVIVLERIAKPKPKAVKPVKKEIKPKKKVEPTPEAKKGRGRPKSAETIARELELKKMQELGLEIVKQGRGRPKSEKTLEKEKLMAQGLFQKKGRGRPKKQVIEETK